MVAFRFLLTFVVIFLFAERSLAFETIIEGKEYKFQYDFAQFSLQHSDRNQEFKGNLTIKALPGNVLECEMTDVEGRVEGTVDYLDELKQKFMVKLDGEKVLELNNTGNSTDDGNRMLLEMIEHIIMDRSDIVRSIKKGHFYGIVETEMPFVGKCESEVKAIYQDDRFFYRARSSVPLCVIKEEALAEVRSMGYEEIPHGGPTEVELTYDADTKKQIALSLYIKISAVFYQNILIDYLGSNDIAS